MSLLTVSEIRESPLYTQMYESRKKMSPSKRLATQNKETIRNWVFPFAAEREYTVWIDKQLRENVVKPVNQYVLNNYLTWVSENKIDSKDIREDGIADILRGIKNVVSKAFSSTYQILKTGADVDAKNSKGWDGFVKESTGVNISLFDPKAKKYVREWADANTEFLKSYPDKYVSTINQIVSTGVSEGIPKAEIADQISKAGKKFRGMSAGDQIVANRIARDQVGKLNSALSRSRMKQAKIDVYKWSTSADERVRGNPTGKYPKARYSHYIMDGMYKQVDNPSKISDNGNTWRNVRGKEEPRHAGQAINCRCVEIPSFIKLKKVVDADIKRDLRKAA